MCCRRLGLEFGAPQSPTRSTFRDGGECLLSFVDCTCHIQGAITGTILIEIRIPVVAGATDVQVILLFSGCEPARAGGIPVPALVGEDACHETFDKSGIRIQDISPVGCIPF
jgi:hypothetical protein